MARKSSSPSVHARAAPRCFRSSTTAFTTRTNCSPSRKCRGRWQSSGAGVIGSEYACMFAALGTHVHLIDGRDTLLPFLDPDLSNSTRRGDGQPGYRLSLEGERGELLRAEGRRDRIETESGRELSIDHLLVCAGRTSPTAELRPGAPASGCPPAGSSRSTSTSAPQCRTSTRSATSSAFRRWPPRVPSRGESRPVTLAGRSSRKRSRRSSRPAFTRFPKLSTVGLTEPQATGEGHRLRHRPRRLRAQPARPDHRRQDGVSEADLPARYDETARRPRHRANRRRKWSTSA